jgi:hypothetical protein
MFEILKGFTHAGLWQRRKNIAFELDEMSRSGYSQEGTVIPVTYILCSTRLRKVRSLQFIDGDGRFNEDRLINSQPTWTRIY